MNEAVKQKHIKACEIIIVSKGNHCVHVLCSECPAFRELHNIDTCTTLTGTSAASRLAWFTNKLAELKGENMETKYDLNTVAGKEQAMRDGYKLRFKYGIGYYDNHNEDCGPFIYLTDITEDKTLLYKAWKEPCTLIPKEKPKTYMTRDEVLGFLANTPGVVVRHKKSCEWRLASTMFIDSDISEYEYTTIDLDGNYSESMEFVK